MEIVSGVILLVIGWLVYNKVTDGKITKITESKEAKVLELKQNEATQNVEQLKKHLAEQQTGKELTPEEVESHWNKKDNK